MNGVFRDLTGQRFGRLLVLKRDGINASRNTMWACRCDCGLMIRVAMSNLTAGHTKSCGCLYVESRARVGNNLKQATFTPEAIQKRVKKSYAKRRNTFLAKRMLERTGL